MRTADVLIRLLSEFDGFAHRPGTTISAWVPLIQGDKTHEVGRQHFVRE